MLSRRFERIFGRQSDPEQEMHSGEMPMEASQTMSYQQWYERDPALFEEECSLLEDNDIKFDCRKLPDGRISFLLHVEGRRTAITCSYHHPIGPVEVHLLEGDEIPSIVDEGGKVDLFAHDGFVWTTDTHIVDVVARVKTLLSIAFSLESQPSDLKEDAEQEDNQVRTADDNVPEFETRAEVAARA